MSSRRAKSGKGGESAAERDSGEPGGSDRLEGSEAALAASVADYLSTHRNFFERHPEVLAELQVPHGPGGAVSLIEHQVKVLRRQLDTERARLAHLITRAREYESLSSRLHGLVLQIIPAADLGSLVDALQDALRREFSAEAVTLRLFPVDPGAIEAADPLLDTFRDFLDREHALCGPLQPDRRQLLFGEPGAEVRSAALVPIRADGRSGVLAIGAADPDRFGPEMGTDLLDRLGEIVGHKLRSLPADPVPRPGRRPAVRKAVKSSGARTTSPKSPGSAAATESAPAGKPAGGTRADLEETPKSRPQSNVEAQSD